MDVAVIGSGAEYSIILKKIICLFIFDCVGSSLLCSLIAESRGYSLEVHGLTFLWCIGFSLQWLLLWRSTGSRVC